MKPVIIGIAGVVLSDAERALYERTDPAGYILFARNVETPDQVLALTDSLRQIARRSHVPILIDQEGGRVARLGPPHWPAFPSAATFGALYDMAPMTAIAAARENAIALGSMLSGLGINVNCLPVLDLLHPKTADAIGDRSFGADPVAVAALGRACLDGLAASGVTGVIKHIPGHGRSSVDSHIVLPIIDEREEALAHDLIPFATLASAPMAMVGHVAYSAWDESRPASQSPKVIRNVIRDQIGFGGLLLSDDIVMEALKGSLLERATACLDAGCDIVLGCHGDVDALAALLDGLPDMPDDAIERLNAAMVHSKAAPDPQIFENALARRDRLMAKIA